MKKLLSFTLLFVCTTFILKAKASPEDSIAIIGRWDLTLDANGKTLPSWFDVERSGNSTLVGSFVGMFGSARPVAKVNFSDGKFSFSIPPQWERGDGDVTVEGSLQNEKVAGTITWSDGKTNSFTGVRAPIMRREKEPSWGKEIKLFNGKDLSGWHALGDNQWVAENGVLKSPKSGSNLITDDTFKDFKLHIEFRYPKGSNSGVYLRGRYEVQIEDDKGQEPSSHLFSGVYGFIAPNQMMAKDAGEWQSYDITLVGRLVTVVANGKRVICEQEIPGITGGAINSNEDEPGPLLIQGDHGPIEFRNIVLTPAQ